MFVDIFPTCEYILALFSPSPESAHQTGGGEGEGGGRGHHQSQLIRLEEEKERVEAEVGRHLTQLEMLQVGLREGRGGDM